MTTLEMIDLINELNESIGLENTGKRVYLLAPSPKKEAEAYVNFLHSRRVFSDELIAENIDAYARKTGNIITEVDIYFVENYNSYPVVSLFDGINPSLK